MSEKQLSDRLLRVAVYGGILKDDETVIADAQEHIEQLEARALRAEAECAELGEAMRQVGIEQFEANAARIRAEAEFERLQSDYADLIRDHQDCNAVRLSHHAALLKAEAALRGTFEAINDDDISGAHLILRTYLAALPEKAP